MGRSKDPVVSVNMTVVRPPSKPVLPSVVIAAMSRVKECHKTGLTRARPQTKRSKTSSDINFSDWRAAIARLENHVEFCEAATTFQRRYPQCERQWALFIYEAIRFPVEFLAQDKRTNTEKCKFMSDFLKNLQSFYDLVEPDFILKAGEELEAPPKLNDVTAHSRLLTLANVRTPDLRPDLREEARTEEIEKDERIRSFTAYDLAVIAWHLIEPAKQELNRLQKTPDVRHIKKGYGLERLGVEKLDPIFRESVEYKNEKPKFKGLDRLLANTINAVLNKAGNEALTLKRLEALRSYLKRSQLKKRPNKAPP